MMNWVWLYKSGRVGDSGKKIVNQFRLVLAVLLVGVWWVCSCTAHGRNLTGLKKAYSSVSPVITIVTGTHAIPLQERLDSSQQPKICQIVNLELSRLWTESIDSTNYRKARRRLVASMALLEDGDKCTFGGTNTGLMFTFPFAMKSNSTCDESTQRILDTGRYNMSKSRIVVSWLLLRPDMVTFETLARSVGVRLRVLATFGHNPMTAAFNTEGCPRIATILANRQIYQQQLLSIMISDLERQISFLEDSEIISNPCADTVDLLKNAGTEIFNASRWIRSESILFFNGNFQRIDQSLKNEAELACSSKVKIPIELIRDSHIPTILSHEVFQPAKRLKKTVFADLKKNEQKAVFIAGVEGVGHHLFSFLGERHANVGIYGAFQKFLSTNSLSDESWERYASVRQNLVDTLGGILNFDDESLVDERRVIFLNTVRVGKNVNMYSIPWGGPQCGVRMLARLVCSVDLLDIAKIVEEAGIDLRIIVLTRNTVASIVSGSVNRNFGTVMSQTRTLGLSSSFLNSALQYIDPRFYTYIAYEDILSDPEESAEKLADFIGLDIRNNFTDYWKSVMNESQLHYELLIDSWKLKVLPNDFEFISDMFGFSESQRAEYYAL